MNEQPLYRIGKDDGDAGMLVPVELIGYVDIDAETDWWEDVDRCFYVPGLPEGRYAVVRLED